MYILEFYYWIHIVHCIYRAITNFGERKGGPGKKKKKRDLPAEVLARLPPSVPTSEVSSIDRSFFNFRIECDVYFDGMKQIV